MGRPTDRVGRQGGYKRAQVVNHEEANTTTKYLLSVVNPDIPWHVLRTDMHPLMGWTVLQEVLQNATVGEHRL